MMRLPPESTFNCSNVYRPDGTSDQLSFGQLQTAKPTAA